MLVDIDVFYCTVYSALSDMDSNQYFVPDTTSFRIGQSSDGYNIVGLIPEGCISFTKGLTASGIERLYVFMDQA